MGSLSKPGLAGRHQPPDPGPVEGRIEGDRPSGLAALRRYIDERERVVSTARPAVSLGADELDARLPEGGLALGALHECVPAGHGDFAATLGFALALAARALSARPGFVLCAIPAHCGFEQGIVHAPGLAAFGLDPDRFIEVGVPKTRAMLWVMEEGLAAGEEGRRALAAVIGVEAGRDYDFTASRRLAMRAERSGATAFLVRAHTANAIGGASAAATRWRVATEPHADEPHAALPDGARRHGNSPGVGAPRWAVSLVKSKRGMPGHRQVVEWDHETLSFRMAAALAGRTPTPVRASNQPTGEQAGKPAGERAGKRNWAAAS